MRNLGGAVGTAALATIITKREQYHSNIIGQSVTAYDVQVHQFLDQTQQRFLQQLGPDPEMTRHQAEILLGQLVSRQAFIMAYSDTFLIIACVLIAAAVAVMFTRGPELPPAARAPAQPQPDPRAAG